MLRLFKQHGWVEEFDLWKTVDEYSKGMGTVEYSHPAEAWEAMQQLNGAEVDGRVIAVELYDEGRAYAEYYSRGGGKGKGGIGGGGQYQAAEGSGGSSKSSKPCKVFFKNVLYETPEAYMASLFRKFGSVVEFRRFQYPDGSPKGTGCAEYRNHAQAKEAVFGLNGAKVDGRTIAVELENLGREFKGDSKGESRVGGVATPSAGQWAQHEATTWGDESGPYKVFFKNCLFEASPDFLAEKFSKFGQVVNLNLWKYSGTGRSTGKGTVEYQRWGEAQAAALHMNGFELGGRPLSVELEKPEKPSYMPVWVNKERKGQENKEKQEDKENEKKEDKEDEDDTEDKKKEKDKDEKQEKEDKEGKASGDATTARTASTTQAS